VDEKTREERLSEIRERHHAELSAIYGSTNTEDWPYDLQHDDPRIPQLQPIWDRINAEIDALV
jgi:hypothetical protein